MKYKIFMFKIMGLPARIVSSTSVCRGRRWVEFILLFIIFPLDLELLIEQTEIAFFFSWGDLTGQRKPYTQEIIMSPQLDDTIPSLNGTKRES